MAPTVRRATAADAEAVVDLVVDAFAVEAATDYFFGDAYADLAPRFFAYLLDLRLRGGEVWLAVEDESAAAVAMLNPPGGLALPDDELESAWQTVAGTFPADVRARLDDYHDRLANHEPAGRHYYLGVLATDPARQGRGLSRTVLGPAFARADARGWDTYLETASAETVSIYQRLGFAVGAEIELPEGPRIWWMRRPTARP